MVKGLDLARFSYGYMKSLVSYPIFSAFFAPVRKCNIKCAYCYQVDAQDGVMTREIFSDRLNFLRERGLTVIQFTGGEPLLWKHLDDALVESKSKGLFTVIATNGTLLEEARIDELHQAGTDYISVSLDSVRGNTAVSPKSLEENPHLLEILEYARHKKNILVSCNAVLTKKNTLDVIELAEVLSGLGIPLSIGFAETANDNLAFRLPRDKELLRSATVNIKLAKQRGLLIAEPDEYFSGFESHLENGNGWHCSRAKLKSLAVDPQGNFLVCTRLDELISQRGLENKAQIEVLKDRLSGIINQCNKECYANCAFVSSYYQKHPIHGVLNTIRLGALRGGAST